MFSLQILFCLTFFVGLALGQTSTGPTCSNPSLLMTPALRAEVLDYINDARNRLKNGELLLESGEHALIPETMPELVLGGFRDEDGWKKQSWDCEVEEEMHEIARIGCRRGGMFPIENYTYFINMMPTSHEAVVDCGLNCVDLVGYYANYLSQHTIYTGLSPNNYISAIHDKAETIGCAIYDCHMDSIRWRYHNSRHSTYNYRKLLYFKITPDVDFGEKIYEVSSNAEANFPSQDVICPTTYGMNIEIRREILAKVNAVRRQIQHGNYILQNGNPALQAVNLPDLIWDCDEEVQVSSASAYGCLPTSDPATIFQTSIPINWSTYNQNTLFNGVSAYFNQLFTQNSNLNFLSQTTTYSTQYPPALVLSDQATIIACASSICTDPSTFLSSYNFVCRAKPLTQINHQLYQV